MVYFNGFLREGAIQEKSDKTLVVHSEKEKKKKSIVQLTNVKSNEQSRAS